MHCINNLKVLFAFALSQVRQSSLTARLACLLFLAFSLPVTWLFTYLSGNDGSGWVRTTTPIFIPSHSMLGFAGVYTDNLVFHYENHPSLRDIAMLSGGPVEPHPLYSIRGLYPFGGTFLAPFTGPVKALMLLNYGYWALAAYAAWRFTRKLFQDELAAFLAVLFVTGGIGWLTNLSDLSSHLASYSFYFLVTLLLYESRVWAERRPLHTHLLLGVVLALAMLNYQNGIVLILFYALVSLRRNRPLHVLTGIGIGLSSHYLWAFHLNLCRGYLTKHYDWLDLLGHTRHTLEGGLQFLRHNLHTPLNILQYYAHVFVQLLVALESLPLVLLGLLSWLIWRKRPALGWFCAVGFLLQIGAIMPQSGWTSARGAYVYGASLFVVAPASYSLAQMIRARGAWRGLGLTLALLVLAFHFYWGTAQFWGNTAPLGTYQSTALTNIVRDPWHAFVRTDQPVVLSLTGGEPPPRLYWGKANIVEAGALPVPPPRKWLGYNANGYHGWKARFIQSLKLMCRSVIIRLPFLLYFTALLLLLIKSPQALVPKQSFSSLLERPGARIITLNSTDAMKLAKYRHHQLFSVMLIWLTAWLGFSIFVALFITIHPSNANFIAIPPGGVVKYSIRLSDAFLQQLEQQAGRDAFVEGFTIGDSADGQCKFRLSIGDSNVFESTRLTHFELATSADARAGLIEQLKQQKELTLEYANYGPKVIILYTWQRAGLPGRRLEATPPLDPESARSLPIFEFRVRPKRGENRTVYLIGF